MNMQYAKAVIAHEEAQRRRLDSTLNNNLGPTRSARPHDERPDMRSWPRGCVFL